VLFRSQWTLVNGSKLWLALSGSNTKSLSVCCAFTSNDLSLSVSTRLDDNDCRWPLESAGIDVLHTQYTICFGLYNAQQQQQQKRASRYIFGEKKTSKNLPILFTTVSSWNKH